MLRLYIQNLKNTLGVDMVYTGADAGHVDHRDAASRAEGHPSGRPRPSARWATS